MTSKYLKGKLDEKLPNIPTMPSVLLQTTMEKVSAVRDTDVEVPAESVEEKITIPRGLAPSTRRNFRMFLKLDHKKYYSVAEFDRLCMMVGGDSRRMFQRLLLGINQRAFIVKDVREVKRTRFLLDLHERGLLFKNFDMVEGIV
jgi:hypothetical protein